LNARIELIPIPIVDDIKPGDQLDRIIIDTIKRVGESLLEGDIVVVAQKVVSKSEGRLIDLRQMNPSQRSLEIAKQNNRDPRIIELILTESVDILRMARGILIAETKNGFVCANAGVDQSNVENSNDYAVALPEDPDLSARKLRQSFKRVTGVNVSVVITDTFGRPFREGQTNVAIGLAGIQPIRSYIGMPDMYGKKLRVTEIAIVDEIASAAELLMGKTDRIPVAIVRGYRHQMFENCSSVGLLRSKEKDIFR
jgi:coenzyme F420-0:L-glutamate ligase/coenzyme F420-1:gamma-L-glutamate ligase